jgi:hypothetical protein
MAWTLAFTHKTTANIVEVADQEPSAEVLGIDLSPIQPRWLPPNCRFLIDDAEDEWLNGDNYDMVHMRTMTSVLKNVPKAMQNSFQYVNGSDAEALSSHRMYLIMGLLTASRL